MEGPSWKTPTMAPVLASRTALAVDSCESSAGVIDKASGVTPEGTKAMLEEPSDHSALEPVSVPFRDTGPPASNVREPWDATVPP